MHKIRAFVAARHWLFSLFVLCLVASPFAPCAYQFLKYGVPDVLRVGDYATLELRTLQAAHGLQLLGPYSRFHWDHPGPAYFYLAVPVYELLHERGPALNVCALMGNFVVAVQIVLTARRLRGSTFALACAILLGIYETLGARFALSDDWNPMVPVLPLALLLFASVRLALGAFEVLPWCLLLASIMVQTHVGYAPAVLLLLGVGSALGVSAIISQGAWRAARRTVVRSVLAASAVAAACWALPLYENWTGHPGNLASLWAFFTAPHEVEHPLRECVEIVASELSIFPMAVVRLFFHRAREASVVASEIIATLQVAALVVGAVAAFRRRDRAPIIFCLFTLGLMLAGMFSARAVRGQIQDYLVTWLTVVGMAVYAALLLCFLPPKLPAARNRRIRVALSALSVPLLALGLWRQDPRPLFAPANPQFEKVAVEVEAYLRRAQIERPLLRVGSGANSWMTLTGLALVLQKHRLPVVVADHWLFLVGPQFEATGATRFELLVSDRRLPKPPRDHRKYKLVSAAGHLFVYLVSR